MAFTPYSSFVSPTDFTYYAMVFLLIGLLCTASFCMYFLRFRAWLPRCIRLEGKEKRGVGNLLQEVVLATVASVFLGLGTFFLIQWAGIFA